MLETSHGCVIVFSSIRIMTKMPQLPQQQWLMKWDIILECFTTKTVSYNQYWALSWTRRREECGVLCLVCYVQRSVWPMGKAAVWLWVWGEEYNSIYSTEEVYFNNVSQRGLTKMIASMNRQFLLCLLLLISECNSNHKFGRFSKMIYTLCLYFVFCFTKLNNCHKKHSNFLVLCFFVVESCKCNSPTGNQGCIMSEVAK